MENLPAELIMKIFTYITAGVDHINVALTCKYFAQFIAEISIIIVERINGWADLRSANPIPGYQYWPAPSLPPLYPYSTLSPVYHLPDTVKYNILGPVKHGIIEGFQNDKLIMRAKYINGILNGEYKWWYPNGNLCFDGTTTNDKLDDRWIIYYEDNRIYRCTNI